MKLTREEHEAFEGLEESYADMCRKLYEDAPKCHFTKMDLDHGDDGDRTVEFWICRHCNHVKEIND